MNVYTRREEMRWAVISAGVLVAGMAVAVTNLATAAGRIVPDLEARAAAKAADARVAQIRPCIAAADRLKTEIDVFRSNARAAHLAPAEKPETAAPPPRPSPKPDAKEKEKEPDADLAWASALPAYRQAKALAPCRSLVEESTGAQPELTSTWDRVTAAAAIAPPKEEDKIGKLTAARQLLQALEDAAISPLVDAAHSAESALKAAAGRAREKAATAVREEPLPEGLLGRGGAMGLGVGLSLIALVLSVLSVRAAAIRRMVSLVPLRDAAKSAVAGAHAAEILRLAAEHNGGEPGLVIGAAFGGAVASVVSSDPDMFVAGVMSGLLFGLGVQWAGRLTLGTSLWRQRAKELGEIEKPTIPIVLVLSGVNHGLEAQFLRFFDSLTPADAAATAERLASQTEERILAAAEAGSVAAAAAAAPMAPPAPMTGFDATPPTGTNPFPAQQPMPLGTGTVVMNAPQIPPEPAYVPAGGAGPGHGMGGGDPTGGGPMR
jgi:hypothetical protein